jgi:ubiquinone/menaquinone biosynthesis C-methylase UbiE
MGTWLAASDEIHRRLSASPSARVADLGCGQGFSTIAIARTYRQVSVDGWDLDDASIADAQREAEVAGVADRVTFTAGDAADLTEPGRYDLVCMFEALHDMARPAGALRAAARMLAPGGSILVVDERVADTFTAPGDAVERMMYGWSVTHCLPAARAENPAADTGTILRSGMVTDLARRAGIGTVEHLAIDNDLFRFYRLVP